MSSPRHFDQIAIALSAICIVHCLAVTFLVALLPLAAVAFGGHFHGLMLWLVIPTSVIGFYLGYREHKRVVIGLLGLSAMTLISCAALLGHGQWSGGIESSATLLGGFVLASAHWLNFQEARRVHVHDH
jgi:hypothetical protein